MSNGYYNAKTLHDIMWEYADAKALLDAGDPKALKVSISYENSKMGPVASVSLLPFLTCPACCKSTCGIKCYAAKLCILRKSCRLAYARNTALALNRSDLYWKQVNAAVSAVRYFRFHVSGDIPGGFYFEHLIECAKANPGTQILIFTKRFELVNACIDSYGDLPENLHVLFSGWTNLTPDNPHKLPETNVYSCEADFNPDWLTCGGNCFECACRGVGCWQAKAGETIAFKLH